MEFRDRVKSVADIADVVGERVRLQKASATGLKGLCPFHTEKTPSFHVNTAHQYYYCFGCQAKGDVFNFLMQLDGLTFPEALRALADRYGVPVPQRSEYTDDNTRLRDALHRIHEIAAVHFQSNLASAEGADARGYLTKRGLSRDTVAQFGLGYSARTGNPLLRLLQREGFNEEQLLESGLVVKREDGSAVYDRFRGRVMFPIHNESGKVIAFGGRAQGDDEPKYLNSPNTRIYEKKAVLYNLNRAKETIRRHERVILVEGYMDVIGVAAAGFAEVVAACGTSLTPDHVRVLRRHTSLMIVNLDPDEAGSRAAEKVQGLVEEGMRVRVLELSGNLDPDEFIKANGVEAYQQRLNNATAFHVWLAIRAREKFGNTVEGRTEAWKKLLAPAARSLRDPIERAAIAEEMAAVVGVDRSLVLDEFRRNGPSRRKPAEADTTGGLPKVERVLLRSLASDARIREVLLPRLRGLTVRRRLQCHKAIELIERLHENLPEFTYADLDARLDGNERALMAGALFADTSGDEVFTPEQAEQWVAVLEREEKQAGIAVMRNELREAERAGDFARALQLMQEIDRVQRG